LAGCASVAAPMVCPWSGGPMLADVGAA
jgi:hypothetical protein